MAPKPNGIGMSSGKRPSGPVVNRRVFGDHGSSSKGMLEAPQQKPCIRSTIDSMVSTGSQAEYFKPHQTMIIFDWDDTLCPSSWIRNNRQELSFFRPAPQTEKFQRPLRELQRLCEAVLTLAQSLGTVVLVTNAMEPWVETSCRNFLPGLMPYIQNIPVIYARSIYETQMLDPPTPSRGGRAHSPGGRALPGLFNAQGQNRLTNFNSRVQSRQFDEMAPRRWKEVAFKQELDGFYSQYAHQSWKNVLSIGDSIFERDAVRRVVLQRPNKKKKCRTKTLKMLDDPTVEELIKQVKIVHDVLSLMVQHDGDLDVEIDEQDLELDNPLTNMIPV